MKKEPTIKNVLAELEHLTARAHNLETAYEVEYLVNNPNNFTINQVWQNIDVARRSLIKAKREFKQIITSKMLKEN